MEDRYISSLRPLWKDEDEETRTKRIMTLGSTNNGIVVKVTKKGLEFNGYYAGLTEPKKYAILREFIRIDWKEFDKLREEIYSKKKPAPKSAPREPAFIDDKPNKKYLEALPVVTLNGVKYYIDMERQERRPVDKPEQVFNFEKVAAKKPI